MREPVSKAEGGCMSACFHIASRARTRPSFLMALGSWKAKALSYVACLRLSPSDLLETHGRVFF